MNANLNLLLGSLPSYTDSMKQLEEDAYVAHQKAFPPLKQALQGKDVVLVATGPTHNFFEPIENAIYVGINTAFVNRKIDFDYLFANDYVPGLIDGMSQYRKGLCKKYFGYHIREPLCQFPNNWHYNEDSYKYYVDTAALANKTNFTIEIDKSIIKYGSSSVISAIQCILWANPSRIYIVGADCYGSPALRVNFYSKLISEWKLLKTFSDLHYPNIEIISINPRGLKYLFCDEYQNTSAVTALNLKEEGYIVGAIKSAADAYKQAPKNEGVLTLYFDILRQSRQFKKVKKLVGRELEKNPTWAEGYRQLSLMAKAQGFLSKEIEHAKQMLECDPNSYECQAYYSLVLLASRKFVEFYDFTHFVKCKVNINFIAYKIGVYAAQLEDSGDIASALLMRKINSDLNPDDELSRTYYCSMILNKIKDLTLLSECAADGLQNNPNWAYGHRYLAWQTEALGQYDIATAHIARAIQICPHSILFREHLVQILRCQFEFEKAKEILDDIKNYEDSPLSLLQESIIYNATSQLPEAIIAGIHSVNLINNAYADVHRDGVLNNLTQLLLKGGMITQAYLRAQKRITSFPDRGEAWKQLSNIAEIGCSRCAKQESTDITRC